MAPRIWLTSDLHLGHANIIRYCERPFADVEAMNEALIERWNRAVGPRDIVYLLGDFSFAKPAPFFQRLNGHIALILGNHDEGQASRLKALPFASVSKSMWVVIDGLLVYLSHFPDDNVSPDAYDLYLHGHTHGTRATADRKCDVGVDAWNYRPCLFAEVRSRITRYA